MSSDQGKGHFLGQELCSGLEMHDFIWASKQSCEANAFIFIPVVLRQLKLRECQSLSKVTQLG